MHLSQLSSLAKSVSSDRCVSTLSFSPGQDFVIGDASVPFNFKGFSYLCLTETFQATDVSSIQDPGLTDIQQSQDDCCAPGVDDSFMEFSKCSVSSFNVVNHIISAVALDVRTLPRLEMVHVLQNQATTNQTL